MMSTPDTDPEHHEQPAMVVVQQHWYDRLVDALKRAPILRSRPRAK